MMNDVFLELSLVILVVLVVSTLMRVLKQPLLIGYILAGILVGPLVLNIVHTSDTIDIFAHFGIALLLFIIGLGLSPKIIKDVGKTATLTGIAQILFTTGVGWLIVVNLGYSPLVALYISIALAFSSTIIILKLLSDKKEHNRLYAKISVGFLLVQDICATIILVVVSALNSDNLNTDLLVDLTWKGILLFIGLYILARYIMPKLKNLVSENQEFLFIFSIAWGLGIGALFHETGFSLEVGALAAGVALASQPYATEVASRLRPLRDFFIIMFFVSLGTSIQLSVLGLVLPQAILLSFFVLIGNPIIVMIIMGFLGFTKKTGFKAGLAVAQISEFSLIFIALVGLNLDPNLNAKVLSLTTMVALITVAASSYMIIYADKLYLFLEPYLGIFEKKSVKLEKSAGDQPKLVLIGYTKGGEQFLKAFKSLKRPFLVIDYDPKIVEQLEQSNLPHTYGDISDLELIEELGIYQVQLLISTISEHKVNHFIATYLKKNNPSAIYICSAENPEQAQELYSLGASYVMMPHYIGGEKILNFIKKEGLSKTAFEKFKKDHLDHITKLQPEQTTNDSKESTRHKIKVKLQSLKVKHVDKKSKDNSDK